MLLDLDHIIPWFLQYKYLIIFPIAVIEGPIITIISGFLSSIGQLNIAIAYVVILVGDLFGDLLYFLLGKYGRERVVGKYGKYIGITMERISKLEKHFELHSNKTLLIAKFAHGAGSIALVAAGIAKVPYKKLISINFFPTVLKSALLMLIGYYFGKAFLRINTYLNYTALAAFILTIGLYVWLIRSEFASKFIDKA